MRQIFVQPYLASRSS